MPYGEDFMYLNNKYIDNICIYCTLGNSHQNETYNHKW